MSKVAKIFLMVAMLCMINANSYAQMNSATLVLDMRNALELPRHFRTTSANLPDAINQKGFHALYMAGSGQFSKLALQRVLRQLRAKKLTIIDLRQESHGFLNGNAISWFGAHDAANANKTPTQIEDVQAQLLQDLAKEPSAIVDKIMKKTADERIAETKPIEFVVHYTASEETIAKESHLRYERIYIQDYHAPSAKEVDRFVDIVKALPTNEWVYFHCRAGIGRTSTFMIMFDMLHNAKNISLEDALQRQIAIGGKDVADLPAKGTYKYRFATERLAFLKKFYQYAQQNQDNFDTTWSQWLKQKKYRKK